MALNGIFRKDSNLRQGGQGCSEKCPFAGPGVRPTFGEQLGGSAVIFLYFPDNYFFIKK
jgi:hypothetical protein